MTLLSLYSGMPTEYFTARQKAYILSLYSPRKRGFSFSALAAQFGVPGGKSTVQWWWKQYDGTITSLEHKRGQGRPRLLTRNQVASYVLQPIRRKNRAHQPNHYGELISRIERNTGKNLSARTIRRYGKEDSRIKQKRTQKITVNEREYTIHM